MVSEKNSGKQKGGDYFTPSKVNREIGVALLTGGFDKPYAFGLATGLLTTGATMDLIGSDALDCPEFRGNPRLRFLNLRGDRRPQASLHKRASRVIIYYAKLIGYTARARPKIFHVLWHNKFELFDRTLLMVYYRCLGKKIVVTAHNVNAGRRDSRDTWSNRMALRIQYRLAHHIFVHTEKMKSELMEEFDVKRDEITVIPFGINNSVPITSLTPEQAKQRLGIRAGEKTLLFFGNIAPYKGLEYLISAFRAVAVRGGEYRLIIVGRPKNCEKYWAPIRLGLREDIEAERVLLREDFIPDEETELYFKAADVFVLPYRHIYQSGVLFLGHSFGLPVLAADVGSLRENVSEGKTGLVFRPEDPEDLAKTIEHYFSSELYTNLDSRRPEIRDHAMEGHSWDKIAQITVSVYSSLLRTPSHEGSAVV
jgi:glycosyltransferase involved in cell wall biosynthesis